MRQLRRSKTTSTVPEPAMSMPMAILGTEDEQVEIEEADSPIASLRCDTGNRRRTSRGIIASDPEIATILFRLSEEGHRQARCAGETLDRDFLAERHRVRNNSNNHHPTPLSLPTGIVIVTSDFQRTLQTANAVVQAVLDHNAGLSRGRDNDDFIPLYRTTKIINANADIHDHQ